METAAPRLWKRAPFGGVERLASRRVYSEVSGGLYQSPKWRKITFRPPPEPPELPPGGLGPLSHQGAALCQSRSVIEPRTNRGLAFQNLAKRPVLARYTLPSIEDCDARDNAQGFAYPLLGSRELLRTLLCVSRLSTNVILSDSDGRR